MQILNGQPCSILHERIEIAPGGGWQGAAEDNFAMLGGDDPESLAEEHPELFRTLKVAEREASEVNKLDDAGREAIGLAPRQASGDIVIAWFARLGEED